jgi:hypothetical protein
MPYTALIGLSDSELVNMVCNLENPTDLEVELMVRLDRFLSRLCHCGDESRELIASLDDDGDDSGGGGGGGGPALGDLLKAALRRAA